MFKPKITKPLLCLLLVLCSLFSQTQAQEHPKLVVGIIIDQMRWDYLYRYYGRYGENGFKRLLNNGFSCENTMINYIPSYTAIGHAAVYTGSVPSINGIAGNEFIEQKTGKEIYCTQDNSVKAVGIEADSKAGKMSPKNLKTTTITDELKLATNFRSKVVAVSLKDRGSILPAGHCADAAFWFDGESGKWISSSWYMDELPDWLLEFNAQQPAKAELWNIWQPLYPAETYTQSSPNLKYEKPYTNEQSVSFTIYYEKLLATGNYDFGLVKEMPFGNTITAEMAKLAVKNYQLGKSDFTDFLAISFSATDYIGHRYGINSIKIEDCYLRLDREIAELLNFLDKQVGKNNYLLFLTADHGGEHNAQFLFDNKIEAGMWFDNKMLDSVNDYLSNIYDKKNIVKSLNNYQVNFNYSEIKDEAEKNKIIKSCIEFFENQESTAYAVETKRVSEAAIPAVIKEKIINGYNRQFCGEIQIILKPHYYSHDSWQGATHGAWNPYDAHIPLIFYGKGVRHGSTTKEVYITDIAPTLAALLKIQMPSGCIGKPIEKVRK